MPIIGIFSNLYTAFLTFLGQVAMLAGETILSIFCGRIRPKLVIQQIAEIGFRSQLVVMVFGSRTRNSALDAGSMGSKYCWRSAMTGW